MQPGKCICGIVSVIIATSGFAAANSNKASSQPVSSRPSSLLPGQDVELSEAETRSDIVILGKVEEVSWPGMDTISKFNSRVAVTVQEVLKGKAIKEAKFSLEYKVDSEIPPSVGKQYIFFLKARAGGQIDFVRADEADERSLDIVKKLIKEHVTTVPSTTPKTGQMP